MGVFRIAKQFRVESGHRLFKHPELCRFPHGHTRIVEVVLRSSALDENDMVCDYAILKSVVGKEVERFDHAMAISADDPLLGQFAPWAERVVVMEGGDATTEVLARYLYLRLREALTPGATFQSDSGIAYRLADGVRVERVRVWETPTSWAEYAEEP